MTKVQQNKHNNVLYTYK